MVLIGIDSVEIKRIEKLMANPRFLKKYFGDSEYQQLRERNFKAESVAANFCAKEAFLKIFGKGLGSTSLKNIELLRQFSGQPYIKLTDISFLENYETIHFSVSVTHTKKTATVVILAEFGQF